MKAGLVIVLFALMGSILAGSIGFTQSPVTETEYQRVSDLNPIVSSEAVTGDELYNPVSNQIGWENVTYQTQSTPSIYSYTDPGTTTTRTTDSLISYGGSYFPNPPTFTNNWPTWSSGERMESNSPSKIIGGYGGGEIGVWNTTIGTTFVKYTFNTGVGVVKNDTTIRTSVYWQNLNDVARTDGWTSGTIVSLGSDIYVSDGPVYNTQIIPTVNTVTNKEYFMLYSQTLFVSDSSADDYYYNSDTNTFYPITSYAPSGKPIFEVNPTTLYWTSSDSSSTLTVSVYTGGETHYVKPYTAVSLTSGTATWSNGYNNTRVQLIVKSGATITTGSFSYTFSHPAFEYLLVTLGSDCYYQGIDSYTSPTEYNVLSHRYDLNMLTATCEPGIDIEYNMTAPRGSNIRIMLDHFVGNPPLYDQLELGGEFERATINNQAYLTVTSFTGESSTAHWYNTHTDLGYEKDVTITLTESSSVSGLTPTSYQAVISSINSLSVSGSSMAYIVNTWVPSDPQGLLWSNPSMNANTYFPETVSTGARVYISSVLVTGSSLTVNGITYETADKKIVIDGASYSLNGLGIDYRVDGHTYIITPTGKTFDLGETTSYVISGTGTWYWSSELDSIVTTTGTQTDILFAQTPDKTWMVFAFIGLMVIGLVGMAAIGRGQLDGWDWIIAIVGIVIALMLVI